MGVGETATLTISVLASVERIYSLCQKKREKIGEQLSLEVKVEYLTLPKDALQSITLANIL